MLPHSQIMRAVAMARLSASGRNSQELIKCDVYSFLADLLKMHDL